ncbi:hypothetical protein N7492_000439 [Penicillium capsulatum]|uniref:FAD dependent oxidoreductase domain-containing protein n=1 Tax=Penicillium capsulatum TaxID=69766 RepID=A0A9W9IR85_9EURO|nr:hypothetical protein N7492_000439 [Penicillium capsulatum]KAJ6130499.1 hypothetical protein N7512_003279 [Penicillium capsulatum]
MPAADETPNVPVAGTARCIPAGTPGECFWQTHRDELHDHRSTDQLPEYSDIVIVGAGYSGVSTAWHILHDYGHTSKSVTIVEARGACSGATGRNGGHARPDFYGHIPTYMDRAGVEAGVEIAEFEISTLRALKKIIAQENIDCDFTLARSIDVWCNEDAAAKAKAVYDRMVQEGLQYMDDVVFYTGDQVEGICGVKGAKACASFTAGTMWPYKFIMHLVRKIVAAGVNLQTHTPVTSIVPSPRGGFVVETPRGAMRAGKVIHASNAYVSGLLPEYKRNIIPCKGICCHIAIPEGVTPPLLNNSYIYRDEENTLSYLVPRADGSIVVGGASALFKPFKSQWYDNVDDSILIDSAAHYYKGFMQRTYQGWENTGAKVDKIWSGVMGYSYDSNPHIGNVPAKKDQYILAGFNGHGMPVIWQTAKALAKMVMEDAPFDATGLPRLFETTQFRLDRAWNGKEEDGDIVGSGTFHTKI